MAITSIEPTSHAAVRRRDRDAGFELSGPSTPVRQLISTSWRMRKVLVVLARKDFYARYRRTSLGLLWALGLPLIQAMVLSIVFTHVVNVRRVVAPGSAMNFSYPVFIYSGMVVWSYFSANMPTAATSVVDNASMAAKIYFPRLMLPLLAAATGVYPLVISLGVLLLLTVGLQHGVGPQFLFVVPASLFAVAITVAVGSTLSALHVYLRDVKFLVQAVMSVMFYLTPVIYSLSAAPHVLRTIVAFGPMAGPIELSRMGTVGADPVWPLAVAAGIGWTVVFGVIGLILHSRWDRVFVDRL